MRGREQPDLLVMVQRPDTQTSAPGELPDLQKLHVDSKGGDLTLREIKVDVRITIEALSVRV